MRPGFSRLPRRVNRTLNFSTSPPVALSAETAGTAGRSGSSPPPARSTARVSTCTTPRDGARRAFESRALTRASTESRGEGVPSTTTWFTPRVPTASSAGGTSAPRGVAPGSTPRAWASPRDGTGASRGASTPTGVYSLLVQPLAPFTSTTPGSLTRPSRPPSARTRTASTPWRSTRSSGGW